MQLQTYIINAIVTILCSVGFGSIVTFIINRKKIKAETQLFSTEIYSTMLGDLRAQINMQGDQLKNQAEQILNLQKKESEYVKIIKNNQMRERGYIIKIKSLEKALKESEEMLKELQIKLQIQ
ncbi:MAG: hypothetical protein EOP47_04650 [Sphingobacteriaceae bacterium]|nr:MAG: hypothetical protein EOP47_04650 [Sphingobacteriaceae bacterium]